MALKTLIQYGLLGSVLVCTYAQANAAEQNTYDERIVEEVVVSAKGWRSQPDELEIAKPPRWQIDDNTRDKLGSRMQVGYDPVLEDIRSTDNRIEVRSNMREPKPSTVFRVSF